MAPHMNCAHPPAAWWGRGAAAGLALGFCVSLYAGPAAAALPEIRTSVKNVVPACVTPQRLMSFLKSRNPNVDKRFADIANLYKRHGERWRVRWDYAFYQMAVETNFLSYKQGNGRWGDVDPKQNNFAGLGTTGGGVPGDRYPNVNTGVLAQIQHLVAYSGEHIADPVGARTKLKQDDIIEQMSHLKRSITFSDLSRRWAVDRHYGASIEWVANGYRAIYCKPGSQRADAEPGRSEDANPEPVQTVATAAPETALADGAPAPTEITAADKVPAITQIASTEEGSVAPAPNAERSLPPPEALGGPPAPAEVEPEQGAETPAEAPIVVAAATPESATAPAASAIATPKPKKAVTIVPVRTIWSRDKEASPAADATSGTSATEPTAAAPAARAKPAQRMAPLPVAKGKLVPGAETPFAANHVPEETPVEEPKPSGSVAPTTAAIEAAPAMPQAPDFRGFAFAPAINLADLHKSMPPNPDAGRACRVLAASYGGKKTLLVRTTAGPNVHYTALTVLEGFEGSMLDNFLKAHAPGGASLGEFENKDAALAKARDLCPGSAAAPKGEGASAG